MIELGAAAQKFLYGARANTAFTFGGDCSPQVINQLLQSGCIIRVEYGDPYYMPGLYRFTPKGAAIGKTLPHRYTIVPAPKMDTPELVAAKCICGYKSSSCTEAQAHHRGTAHINAKKVQA